MLIAGIERRLDGWAPSRLRLRANKPEIDVSALPETAAISSFPTDYDQGSLSSCGPNSVAEVYEHALTGKWSRLFLYYFTRATEGDLDEDAGVTLPELMSVAHTMGMPPESEWDYDNAYLRTPPPLPVFADAYKHRVSTWDVVADLDHLLYEVSRAQPVTLGFQVPASMQSAETAATGIVQMPTSATDSIGGHAVNAVGYDKARRAVRCTCHWGAQFGDAGTIWLPFAMWDQGFVHDMAAIRSIT